MKLFKNELNITWLYPDILNLHGDRGNVQACEKIAEMCTEFNTGARAVGTILQNVLFPTFSVIDKDTTISSVTLTVKNDTLTPVYYHSKLRKLRGLDAITNSEESEPEEHDEYFYDKF